MGGGHPALGEHSLAPLSWEQGSLGRRAREAGPGSRQAYLELSAASGQPGSGLSRPPASLQGAAWVCSCFLWLFARHLSPAESGE